MASYTFRNFGRTQMIGFMKQLSVVDLKAKDVRDHLPADERGEAAALQSYSAAGNRLHAAGVISFTKDKDADIRAKVEYAKRARIPIIVGGDPSPESLPRIERFVKEYDNAECPVRTYRSSEEDCMRPEAVPSRRLRALAR